jgi:tetratricopeptide (TPR) repeat protein
MKSGYLHSLRCLSWCLVLVYASGLAPNLSANAQKPINLDRVLEESESPDRAVSYYHYALAKWHEDKGDLTKAISEMKIALKYNQSSPAVHLELAGLLEKSGNTREAIEHAQEAARLDPEDPEPHWLIATMYLKSQEKEPPSSEILDKAVRELETLKKLNPSDERSYYALGGIYFELNQPEKAIEAYEKFQELVASTDSGYREIAKYYIRDGKNEKAIDYLLKGLKIQPDSAESLVILGELYSKLDKSKEAIPIYRKLLEVTGNNAGVSRQLASSLIDSGEYNEAVDLLNELLKIYPRDKKARILLGRAQIELREYPKAIDTLQSVLSSDSSSMEAQFYLGNAYQQSGDLPEAIKVFSGLLDKTPADSDESKTNRLAFQQHLADCYLERGENEKAVALYQEAVKVDPALTPQLVEAYRLSRQFDKALPLGKQEFLKNPDDIRIAVIYARTLVDSGKVKEGTDVLSKLLTSNPSNIGIYVTLSQVYIQNKRYADAEKILRRAEDRKLDSERDREQLKYWRATVYERQKDFDRAESLFKEILKSNPNNAAVLNYIGYMLADQGVRLDEAVQYVKEALNIEPRNGAYLDSLGWAFFKLNDYKNAEHYLLQADELIKNDPVIDEHLGDLYFKTGDLPKAREFWTKSISIGTEPEDIQKVRKKLEALEDTLRKQRSGK